MRTTHTHIAAPTYRGRRKFVGSLLLLLLVAFSFWGGTSGNAARNWFARPGNASAAVASPTVTATLFATITVNTTADDNTVNGNCTLREAIIAANTNAAVDACTAGAAGGDNIVFNLGAGTPSIAVTGSALPDITEPVVIDGATGGATRVELNGAAAGAGANGLTVKGGGSTIKSLVINRFPDDGVEFNGAGGNTIVNCYLGTDVNGTAALGNTFDGVFMVDSVNNTVGGTTASERNLLSGNGQSGVNVAGATATGNKVVGNYIGVNATGAAALGNTLFGVLIAAGSNNTIGGATAGERNLISGNNGPGVRIFSTATGNKVAGNYIGTDVTGAAALGNASDGVVITGSNNTVGGTTAGERNLISGNKRIGVFISGASGTGNKVIGNYIGTDATGAAALGNVSDGVQITGPNNLVGGVTAGERNLISGNTRVGVLIAGASGTANKVLGNYIGTNVSGTAALGNTGDGVQIQSANNTVGGTTVGERNLISGNKVAGVLIVNSAATGNKVSGNYLGTDVTGTGIIGNLTDGVAISAPNNTVGGLTAGERNIISANLRNGVIISGTAATGNKVIGNYIGTDVNGTASLSNSFAGVRIQSATNTVGGTTVAERNLISGNFTHGVSISGAAATGNKVTGNYIGTDVTGTAVLAGFGNFGNGVSLSSAPNNIVGGTTPGERNLISGNSGTGSFGNGVFIEGATATGNKVTGNYIGTDVNGTVALGNEAAGVTILSANNSVGGTAAGERNLISGNKQNGVFLSGTAATGNKVTGNFIGTNATGTAALGNILDGVGITGPNNTVGGTTAGERNLISKNRVGVIIAGAAAGGNKVIGNYIGTDVTGTAALGNTVDGVNIQSPTNTVGGTTAGERNLISANNGVGVIIQTANGTGNKVTGNFIGTDVTGTAALGQRLDGVLILSNNNTVGGTTAGERNLISGGNRTGVTIYGTGNKVMGNYLGTDVTGTVALGNNIDGVQLRSPSNIVGGTTAGERNLISGNTEAGVYIVGAPATGNKVTGNYIGTDVTGTAALGNTLDGVAIQDAASNTVGGTTAGERNLISGNARIGVIIAGIGTDNKVIGNYIGADVNGAVLGNVIGDGVNVQSSNNIVGGTTAAERNLIIGNGRNGVTIRLDTATGNKILGNSIFNNAALGIDLFPLGLSVNDAGDADTGANKLQNFPVLTGLTNTTITGTLDSLPANTTYPVRIEFFANTSADASGNGEGEVFLGATSVAAPGAFNFNYTPVAGKPFITATATDNAGNTSEFSSALTGAPTVAITDPFSCSGPGNALTVRVAISNPAASTQTVSFTAALPAGLVGVPGSGTSSVGTAPTVTATSATFTATLTAGQTANVTYQVQVGDTVASGTQLCITTTSTVGAAQGPAVQTCATVNCPSVGPGTLGASNSPLSDQRAGSVLIYNIYTSSTDPTRQNTRISLTNTNPTRSISVHLFFVDGASCAIADSYICLTANQTASFLASDLDPGATGYLVAVATDAGGCPLNFNYLIGDEYVKFSSGHAANLAAEAISAVAGGLPLCDTNSTTATLAFDGVSYSVVPRVLALDNVASRADGNDTMLIVNRLGGNLGTGAATLGTLFGILYDDAENGLSFSLTGTCQLRNSLSNTFPRTAPRFENFIPAGRSGWLKLFSQSDIGISGAVINFNPNAITSAGAFNQGHNLHVLTTTNTAVYTIPVFPPGC
ncbi:MAG: CSLREA domain-containing protein [Acidobacteriota bacterium]